MRGVLLIFCLYSLTTHPQSNLPYKVGETLFYDISYGHLRVGSGELKIEELIQMDETPTFHIVGKGKTSSFFDWFFKVRDTYETYFDTASRVPVRFIRDIYEGGYEKYQRYQFNHQQNLVFAHGTSYKIKSNTQDMLSALFYARTFKKEKLNQDTSFFVPIFMDEENYFL